MQFSWPLETIFITQNFGNKSKAYVLGYHFGIDLRAKKGTPVYAAQDGEVVISKSLPPYDGYGCYIAIEHEPSLWTLYAHLDQTIVSKGQKVLRGQLIGYTGGNPRDYGALAGSSKLKNGAFTKAGFSTAPHLHFELDRGAISPKYGINPKPYITLPFQKMNSKNQELKIPDWAKSSIEKAKQSGIITDWSNPFEVIGSEKLEWILEKANLLDPKKHEKGVSLIRLACVLDKLGFLD